MSADQWVLRACVLVSPLAAIFAAFAAAGEVSWGLAVVVLAVAAVCAAQPDSNIGFFMIVLLAWHWAATVDERRTPWLLVAALAVLVFHTTMAATTVAPWTARWSSPMRARWLRRVLTVAALTSAAWGVQLALAGLDAAGNAVLLSLVLVVLVGAALALRTQSVSER